MNSGISWSRIWGVYDNLLVSKLASNKQESTLQNAESSCNGYSVKVFDLDLVHGIALIIDRDLVQVAFFALQQQEERILRIKKRGRQFQFRLVTLHSGSD